MTRSEAKAFIAALVGLRASAADDQALESVSIYPVWKECASYISGERVRYNDTLYKVLQDHTSQADWTPDVASALFTKVLIPNPEVIPEWVQPDSTNPYQTGDKVTHNSATWISTVDNNVWEPGVYGWDEVLEGANK